MPLAVFGIGPIELIVLALIGGLLITPLVVLAVVLGSRSGDRLPPPPPPPPPLGR